VSEDGLRWTDVAFKPGFGTLCGHRSVAAAGRIWVIGGYARNYREPDSEEAETDYRQRKIWHSADGISWQALEMPGADHPDMGFGAVEFQDGIITTFGHRGRVSNPTIWIGR
jgi:hypothetical protein